MLREGAVREVGPARVNAFGRQEAMGIRKLPDASIAADTRRIAEAMERMVPLFPDGGARHLRVDLRQAISCRPRDGRKLAYPPHQARWRQLVKGLDKLKKIWDHLCVDAWSLAQFVVLPPPGGTLLLVGKF